MILLIGLMTKNGILIVEFANQLRERGRSVREAVIESSVQRLRPILMTSIATIGGAIPLAWSTGAGAEARNAIGWVIVGGVALSTLLTTLVVPSLYLLIGGYSRPPTIRPTCSTVSAPASAAPRTATAAPSSSRRSSAPLHLGGRREAPVSRAGLGQVRLAAPALPLPQGKEDGVGSHRTRWLLQGLDTINGVRASPRRSGARAAGESNRRDRRG
jgi:hypothetical protein